MFRKAFGFGILVLIGLGVPVFSQIYHIEISGTIDLGLPPYIERVINEAKENNARAVLLEVNTFGGRVDAATQIKDLLLNSPVETIAYVNKRAISAGALITLSCKTIGMAPGSSMGAATVVNQSGEKAPEKAISYFRAEMGATAEKYGRNRKIAEGMVDEDVVVEGLSEKGKLITLTTEDALKWGMADYEAPTLTAFLDSLGLQNEPLIYTKISLAEKLVRFLTGPIVSSMLITLGLLGLFFEIKSPGWGVPGTLGLLFLALFFGSHYLINLASSLEIILFFVGVVLLLLEIFVIPGFGIAGVAGIVAIFASLYMSLIGKLEHITGAELGGAAVQLGAAIILTVVGGGFIIKYGPRTGIWRKISLEPEETREEGYVAQKDYSAYVGREGIAVSPLRPAGVGLFNSERLDVVTEGEFIEKDTPIRIIRVEGYRLVVRALEKEDKRSKKEKGKGKKD